MSTHTESPQRPKRRIPSIRAIAKEDRILSRCDTIALSIARQMSEERQQTEGYIYFVQCGEFVKIGYTANPNSRMSKFKTNNPYECRLVALIDGGKIIEAQMHERFAEFHHRGEWYRCGDALMSFIASLSEQPTVSV